MKIVAKKVGVDAGMIIVCDSDYFLKNFDDIEFPNNNLAFTKKVKNGKYNVDWKIDNTWKGYISGQATLNITGGVIVVVDPCYVIAHCKNGEHNQTQWMKWLNSTNYGDNLESDKAFVISSMGGDGEYNVKIEMVKIK